MHIDRADEIAVATKAAGAACPIAVLGLVRMPADRTPARCSSFRAGEARDAGLCRFVREIDNVLAVLPQGHTLVVMPARLSVAHAVRVAYEERSYLLFDAEVDDRSGRLVPQVADTPLGSSAVLVPGALQLLPASGVLGAAALLFSELAQLPAPLPLERTNAAPGHDSRLACVGGHGGQVVE